MERFAEAGGGTFGRGGAAGPSAVGVGTFAKNGFLSHPLFIMSDMTRQLVLIDDQEQPDWRLDEHTREAGRRGVAEARRALADAAARRSVRHAA